MGNKLRRQIGLFQAPEVLRLDFSFGEKGNAIVKKKNVAAFRRGRSHLFNYLERVGNEIDILEPLFACKLLFFIKT